LSARIAPEIDRITRFDRWAHRVASASGAWRTRSALEETAFSQVRTDPDVRGAWIVRGDERPLAYPPESAMPDVALRAVQVPALGPCEAALATIAHDDSPVPVLVVALDHDGLRTVLALSVDPSDHPH
jgi:hypothetical protein